MERTRRTVNLLCAVVLALATVLTLARVLGVSREAVLPRSARPGRVVAVSRAQRYRVAELDIALALEDGRRLPLLRADSLEHGGVLDQAAPDDFEGGGLVTLRFVTSGEVAGAARLETLEVRHPGVLQATGVFVEFTEGELTVRTGGRQAVYRQRGGNWERVTEQ